MTKHDLINRIGAREYQDACVRARRDSASPDFGRDVDEHASPELPHELADLIWEGGAKWREKIELFFEVYDDMPAYGHLL